MLDMSLIRGFYEPELVDTCWCFHSFESLKTAKKILGWCFFIQFSLPRSEKYKKIHRRTLLAPERLRYTFLVLSRQGPKKG